MEKYIAPLCFLIISLFVIIVVCIVGIGRFQARDIACQKLGYERGEVDFGRSVCIGETDYIDVVFDCEGFFKQECKALKEK